MMDIKRVSAKMVPALAESISGQPTVGDIGSVPAVRVELKFGGQIVESVGIIDSGADVCVLDEHIFEKFQNVNLESVVLLATGFSRQTAKMLHLGIRIIGDEPNQAIEVENVPVVIAKLDRQMLVMGRRGLLERLIVELDFPQNQLKLIFSQPATNKYPALAHEFPSLDSAIKSLEENHFEQAIMMVAWDMERFLDRILTENPGLLNSEEISKRPRSLGEKLRLICQSRQISDLTIQIREFVDMRNDVAHNKLTKLDRKSTERVLEAAETIISRIKLVKADI